MSDMALSPLHALDFSSALALLTHDFTGRAWVFDEVDRWLASGAPALFLLTGEPGVGKSAIAAKLVLARPDVVAHHFCIAGRAETIIPSTALRSLAAQLGTRLPGYGQALANTIKPTHLTVQVEINVDTMSGGQIAGVVINNLTVLDPQTELEILLRAPLARLAAPERPLLIVIDSLDEAATLRSDPTLVALLANADRLPGWLRIFCTSRPDRRVLREFERLNPCILAAESRMNLDDIRQYVRARVGRPALAQRLQDAGQAAAPFCALLAGPDESADAGLVAGNFLFARILLDDIEAGRQSLADPQALPRSLDAIYYNFLLRFSSAEWQDRYQPLFGVLEVALEPLAEAQIARFSGQPRTQLRQNLGVLRQFLDVGQDQDGNETFRLFHRSLTDYLANEQRSKDFWCAPEDFHRQIVGSYLQAGDPDWSACDGYGLRQLPQHLIRLGDLRRLAALLLDYRWLQAKLYHTDIRALIVDYDLALAASERPSDPEVLQLVRKALRLSSHILAVDKRQLAAQLTGRLLTAGNPAVQALLQQIGVQAERPWLRPVSPSLLPAASPIMFVLSTHTYPIRAVAVTPDGRHAVSAAEDKTLKVWDLQTGADLRTLVGHDDGVLAVATTPDGRFAVSGSLDKTVRIWDLQMGTQARRIEAHDAGVSAVAVTPDGRQIVSGSYDGSVKLWDLETGSYCRTLRGHVGGVNALALTPDGGRLVTGSYDQTVRLWDLTTGQELHTFAGHRDQVSAVAIAPDGRLVVSASFDRTLKLWDLERKIELQTLSGHDDVVSAVAISSTGQLISASWDRTLRVWDLARREPVSVLAGHAFRVQGVAVTPDGRCAISASGDTTLNVWDLTTPAVAPPMSSDAAMAIAIAITPDSRYAVSCTREPAPGTFTVWDLEAAAAVYTARGYLGDVREGRLMLKAVDGQSLLVRDLQTQTDTVLPLGGWTNRKAAFLPDGRRLLFEDLWTPIVHLASDGPAERRIAFEGHRSEVYDVAVTPDGKRAITGSDDRTLRVWELDSGKAICALSGHTRQVWSVGVAGDGRTAVSASDDRDVIVWDIERQSLVARFSADGPLTACAIAPDGGTVLAGDEAGRMHILRFEKS